MFSARRSAARQFSRYAAPDAIRAAVLEAEGYAVDLIEFVDFEHSPKNLMIRASFTGKRRTDSRARAEALQKTYGFRQSLLELVTN